MKKSARVSEKLVSPGLPGLQVATRLMYAMSVKGFGVPKAPYTLYQGPRSRGAGGHVPPNILKIIEN